MKSAIARIRHSRRGATVIEMVTAVSIFTLLSLGGLGLLVGGANSWNRDFARGSQETDVTQALRRVEDALRFACEVQVDTNGLGITYFFPVRDAQGRPLLPIQSDGTARRIWRAADGTLRMTGFNRPLLRNVPADAPIFSATTSQRAVRVALRTSTSDGRSNWTAARTVVVQIRNAP